MKINDLFERELASPSQRFYFEFALELSEEFTQEDAQRVVSTILKQSKTKLLHSRLGDAIGTITVSAQEGKFFQVDEYREADWVDFVVFSFDKGDRDYAQKLLRRLSRGKPRFKILDANSSNSALTM